MKTAAFLGIVLYAMPWALRAEERPIRFARSGQNVEFPVRGEQRRPEESLTLMAYGRPWGSPVDVKNGMVEFLAPTVRVPVVFRLMTAKDATDACGEVVVYPDRPLSWEKDLQFVAVDTPDWFDSWANAVGMPLERLPGLASGGAGRWRHRDKQRALLVLGRKSAGRGLTTVEQFAATHQASVFVLEADWLGIYETIGAITVSPKQATGALADLRNQRWPVPPTFCRRVAYWPGLANRQAWLVGSAGPLVEEIYRQQHGTETPPVVLNYLPWQDQLGRCEMADELFLRLLTQAAQRASDRPPLAGQWCLLDPSAKEIQASQRPVLAAALSSVTAPSTEARGYVIDLRGQASLPGDRTEWLEQVKRCETWVEEHRPLLILGDHPILDAWEWLKLDRAEQRSRRPGIVWWPENSLPPSRELQWRLMQQFTQWNVWLGDSSQETNHANRNEP